MKNDTEQKIRPEWCVIGVDETAGWNLKPELSKWIDRILAHYAYNRRVATYCCEITPSYWLDCLTYDAHTKPDCPEEIRDEIHNELLSVSREGCYMHVSSIEALAKKNPQWHTVLGDKEPEAENTDQTPEWVLESWNGNPKF